MIIIGVDSLVFNGKELGTRFSARVKSGSTTLTVVTVDTDSSGIETKIMSWLKSLGGVESSRVGVLRLIEDEEGYHTQYEPKFCYYCSDDRDLAFVKREFERVLVDVENSIKSVTKLFRDYSDELCRGLKREGVIVPGSDICYDKERLTMSIRFIGGYQAWTAETEDLCDGGTLDRNVQEAVMDAIKKFNSGHSDVSVSVSGGEKCYSYFEVTTKFFSLLQSNIR